VEPYPRPMPVDARRLLVVEDEPLLASLIAETLRAQGFEVDTAGSVPQARERIEEFDPDLLLLDISLGNGPTGIHLAHALQDTRPDIAILFLTRFAGAASARAEGIEVPPGAGFLLKHRVNDSRYLIDAIEQVFAEKVTEVRHDRLPDRGVDHLSGQARTVLALLAEGCSNNEIARRVDLSVKSVERWIDAVYKELGIGKSPDANARVEAAKRYFMAAGIPTAPADGLPED